MVCVREGSDQERRASIRALVAILLCQPQSPVDAPGAVLTHRDLGLDRDSMRTGKPDPLPYYRLPELYSPLGAGGSHGPAKGARRDARAPGSGTARVIRRRKPTRAPVAEAVSPGMAARAKPKDGRRRPGSGGRMPREGSGTATLATSLLKSALGEPTEVRSGTKGARCEIWERPDLRALVSSLAVRDESFKSLTGEDSAPGQIGSRPRVALVNRLSSKEIQGGETIGGQILEGLRCAIRNGCEVVAVLASTHYRSELTFEEREDFNWTFEQVELGLLDGVVYRGPERVARKQAVVHPFYEKSRKLGIRLFLSQMDREVDWDDDGDHTLISILNAIGEAEARQFARKSMEARRRRWVEEGRGWPGKIPFGFRRNKETKYLEVDPEQWPFVEFIHANYGRLARDGKNGCRAIAEALAEQGCDLSPEKVRKILTDPIYTDGNYSVNCDGVAVACEPVPLERPIPRSTFQRNSEMLIAQKGSYRKTEPGTHLLHGLPVEHAPCRDHIDPKSKCPPYLRVKVGAKGEPAYWHRGKAPKSCHGFHVSQRELEGAVVRKLLELAEDEQLQAAWSAASFVDDAADQAPGEDIETSIEVQRAVLRQEISALENEHAHQIDLIAELAAKGTRITSTHRAVAERIEQDLDTRRKRLEMLDASARRRHAEEERSSKRTKEELLDALRSILTEDIPEDPDHKVRRQALVECCLSRIVVHDIRDDDGGAVRYEIELFGPLVPEQAIRSGAALPVSPLDAGRHILEAELRDREENQSRGGVNGAHPQENSSTQVPTYKELSRIRQEAETPEGRRAQQQAEMVKNQWPSRFRGFRGERMPSFRSPCVEVGLVIPRRRGHGPGGATRPKKPFVPEEELRQILVEVVSTLPHGEPLNGDAIRRWLEEEPANRITYFHFRASVRSHRFDLRTFIKVTVPGVRIRKHRPRSRPWTFEACKERVNVAVAEHFTATGQPLRCREYLKIFGPRGDFPSLAPVTQAAALHQTTLTEMLHAANIAQGTEGTPEEERAARIERCRGAILDAASTLPGGRPPTYAEYDAWQLEDPSDRPTRRAITVTAEDRGQTFTEFRKEVCGPHRAPRRTHAGGRPAEWTEGRCLEALQAVAIELEAQGQKLTTYAYDRLSPGRSNLPSSTTIKRVARKHGVSYAAFLRTAVRDAGDPST